MMYVLGMSHAINVLKAASRTPLSFSHENWSALSTGGKFFDIDVKPGTLAGDTLKAFIASPATGWGSVAELRTLPDGQRQVAAVDGFVDLLLSLEGEQEQGMLFSFVHGNEHSMLSLVQHPQPYDFYLPQRPDLELAPDRQPIPYEIVRQQMARALNPTIGCLAMTRMKLPRMRLVHVMPPPPIESEAQIMHAPEVFREQLTQFGITPLSIRLKYHLLATDVLRSEVSPFGVTVLECPLQAVAASGAIKNEYAFGATHANEAYGALVFQQMQDLANGGV